MKNLLKDNNIAVSILDIDSKNIEQFFENLKDICKKNKYDKVIIHYDIVDGKFTKATKSAEMLTLPSAKEKQFYTDVHLMVDTPTEYIDKLVKLGASSITVHSEIANLDEVLNYLNVLKMNGNILNIGLAIKPKTRAEDIVKYIPLIDMVLVMSVEPGYGGQEYILNVNDKIKFLRDKVDVIEVDGGVNNITINEAKKSGAKIFVVGSYLTKDLSKFEENLANLYSIITQK